LQLSRYRTVIVQDTGPIRDSTIENLTVWLRDTPGLLYVHRFVNADNELKDATVADHVSPHALDWPWEQDLETVPGTNKGRPTLTVVNLTGESGALAVTMCPASGHVNVTGENARTLLARDGKPVLVLWQHPKHKGAVLLDTVEYGDAVYIETVRDAINRLAGNGIGVAMNGPLLHETIADQGLTASATTRYHKQLQATEPLDGIELLTGELNPDTGTSRGTVVTTTFTGKYVVATGALHAFASRPFTVAETKGNAMRLASPGLIRVTGPDQTTRILDDTGQPLPAVDPETPHDWMFLQNTPGIIPAPGRKPGDRATWYVRATEPIRVTVKTTAQ